MRKDVKLAFVVGGILISVLVVYVLVVPGGQKRPDKQAVTLDTTDAKPSQTNTDPVAPPAITDKSADAKPADATPADAKPADTTDQKVADAGATTKPTDPFASGTSEERWMLALNRGSVPMMTSAPPAQSSQGSQLMASKATRVSSAPPALMAQAPSSTADQGAPSTQPVTMVDSASPHAGMRTHVVKPGESIAKIAEAAYGSQNYWPYIIRANPGIVAEKIRPGMTINLPAESDVKTPAASGATASTAGATEKADPTAIKPDTTSPKLDPQTQYEVQSGDSLAKIAMKLYGNSGKWQAIYDLNKEAIGDNPAKVKVKSILKLPEPPTTKS